jgi:hypothetical protein
VRRGRRLGTALALAVFLATLAGGTGGVAQAGGGAKGGPDLSTVEAAKTYLVSQGFDPSKFVYQVGLKNYSGSVCPGLDWNCTKANLVVQIATAGGVNYADCAENAQQCVIVQGSNAQLVAPLQTGSEVNMHGHCPSGDKEKRLMSKETDDGAGVLTCIITQENLLGGDNHAVVGMSVHDNDGATQLAREDATVTQSTTGDGDNHAVVQEEIVLDTHDEPDQMQDGFQSLNLTQDTEAGDNFADVKQIQNITALAQSPDTTQKQNTLEEADLCLGPSTNANSCVRFDQTTGTGKNDININQDHNVDAVGAGGQQNQGCESKQCTLEVDGSQQTAPTSVNNVDDHQSVTYTLKGPEGTMQFQDPRIANGPGSQSGGPDDLWKVAQFAGIFANDADIQAHINQVDDFSSGTVDANSVIILNDERFEIECTGSGCFYTQACGAVEEEENCGPSVVIPPSED